MTKKASQSTCVLVSDRVKDGYNMYVANVAVRNNDTDGTTCDIAIYGGGYTHIIGSLTLTSKGTWYTSSPKVWLSSGERLAVIVSGATAGDAIEAHLTGHYAKK